MSIESHTSTAVIRAITVPRIRTSLTLLTPVFVRVLYRVKLSWMNLTKGSFKRCLMYCLGPNWYRPFSMLMIVVIVYVMECVKVIDFGDMIL